MSSLPRLYSHQSYLLFGFLLVPKTEIIVSDHIFKNCELRFLVFSHWWWDAPTLILFIFLLSFLDGFCLLYHHRRRRRRRRFICLHVPQVEFKLLMRSFSWSGGVGRGDRTWSTLHVSKREREKEDCTYWRRVRGSLHVRLTCGFTAREQAGSLWGMGSCRVVTQKKLLDQESWNTTKHQNTWGSFYFYFLLANASRSRHVMHGFYLFFQGFLRISPNFY